MLSRNTFNLIPIRDKSKIPAISWGEYQNKKYEGELNTTNYAVICGKISGCVVIDIDSPELIQKLFINNIVKSTTKNYLRLVRKNVRGVMYNNNI